MVVADRAPTRSREGHLASQVRLALGFLQTPGQYSLAGGVAGCMRSTCHAAVPNRKSVNAPEVRVRCHQVGLRPPALALLCPVLRRRHFAGMSLSPPAVCVESIGSSFGFRTLHGPSGWCKHAQVRPALSWCQVGFLPLALRALIPSRLDHLASGGAVGSAVFAKPGQYSLAGLLV